MVNKSETVRWKILSLVAETPNIYINNLCKILKKSHQSIGYHVKNLEKDNLIVTDKEGNTKMLRITEKGVEYLSKKYAKKPSDRVRPRFANVHQVQYTVPIIKVAEIFFPNSAQMKGWVRKWDWIGEVYVEETPKNLIFRLKVEASSEWEATVKARNTVDRLCEHLEKGYGVVLGRPKMSRKPHYVVVGDPVARTVGDHMRVSVPDVGHIDKSDEQELEFDSPELVAMYMRSMTDLPNLVDRLYDALIDIKGGIYESKSNQTYIIRLLGEMIVQMGNMVESNNKFTGELKKLLKGDGGVGESKTNPPPPPPDELYG